MKPLSPISQTPRPHSLIPPELPRTPCPNRTPHPSPEHRSGFATAPPPRSEGTPHTPITYPKHALPQSALPPPLQPFVPSREPPLATRPSAEVFLPPPTVPPAREDSIRRETAYHRHRRNPIPPHTPIRFQQTRNPLVSNAGTNMTTLPSPSIQLPLPTSKIRRTNRLASHKNKHPSCRFPISNL